MSALAILDTLAAVHEADIPARRQATAELVEKLGRSDWAEEEPDAAEDSLGLVQRASGIRFVAVPGGEFDMGLTTTDVEDASEYVDWGESVAAWMDDARSQAGPVHRVHVLPFLIAREPLRAAHTQKFFPDADDGELFRRDRALVLASGYEARLPSEAEYEWLARDGGIHSFVLDAPKRSPKRRDEDLRSRFGLQDLLKPHWMEDDWHPDYDGAPNVSSAWMEGSWEGVRRGGFSLDCIQDPDEWLFGLAAVRFAGGEPSVVRLAWGIR